MKFFITATGTDCGKTLVSAIFCEALRADYWKPVQTGAPPKDSDTVKSLVSYQMTVFPETHLFTEPVSPHLAARLEGKKIELVDFEIPSTDDHLIVEGAGGILVPLNDKGDTLVDILNELQLEVVLVVRLYLGCINHAFLTINELNRNNISIKGLVFNGTDTFGAISIIEEISKLPVLLHIQEESKIDSEMVARYAQKINI